jgi:hypothetical protein
MNMQTELQEELFDIEPTWFVRDDIRRSLMAFGFDVGDGWFKLLRGGMQRIKSHIEDAFDYPDRRYPHKFEVQQVKEKYGTLRFYTWGGDSHVDAIIRGMELASSYICEDCGASGEIRPDLFWIRTLCDSCYASRLEPLIAGQIPEPWEE